MAQEPRLADHFPRVEKSCRKVAATFFTCFSEAGRMKDGSEQYDVLVSPLQDAGAGTRGLESCVREMASYDKCMLKALKKKPMEIYRVQEEYRTTTR